jgi:hypothetical protein
MRKFKTIAFLGLASLLLIAGCATTAGGPTDPIATALVEKIVPNMGAVLSNDGVILSNYAAQGCNAEASHNYNIAMLACGNPAGTIGQIPLGAFNPLSASQATTILAGICGSHNFLTTMPATVPPGNCPAPAPAPSPTAK